MKLLSRLLLLSSVCFTAISTPAQTPIPDVVSGEVKKSASIAGSIMDSLSRQPLEWCSVVLQKNGTEEQSGINADSAGYFRFDEVEPGSYTLSVFYVGYDKLDKKITVPVNGGQVDAGTLYLYSGAEKLGEVTVTDFRKLIEQRPDGIVYNAERDATNKGSTAAQLLRKVPMVTVDLEGNVQLRGNGNIKVLINNKPSTIIASSVKDALRQIPADNIKQVEVITTPGAKYDGEGAAGVINIITRKSLIQGVSGNIYTGGNYRFIQDKVNGYGGVNLTYRQDKLGINANVGGGHWTNRYEGDNTRTDFPGTPQQSVLSQAERVDGYGTYLWGEFSADYQIDSLQSLQAGINVNPGKWTNKTNRNTQMPDAGIDYRRRILNETPQRNYAFNGSYSRKFRNNPLRTLDILSQYTIGNNRNDYELQQHDNGTDIDNYKERNLNKTSNREFTVQADYVQPLKKAGQKIETGLKYINRGVGSDYNLATWNTGNADYITDPSRSNRLDYRQQVAAAYAQVSTPIIKKLSLVAGARYEYTNIKGNLRDNGGAFTSDFHNLLPIAILSLDMKNYSKLKLSYNQRIERPSIDYVNPFVNYSDQLNIQYGNPELEPERTHNLELGYSAMIGQRTMLNVTGFFRNTDNAIEAIATVGADGINRTTYKNVATNNALGLNLFASSTFFGRWMVNVNGNLYYKMMKSVVLDITNNGTQYDFNLYTNLKVNDKWSVEGFGMYAGRQVTLQGTQTGWFYYNLGFKRSVLKGKGDLTLVGENFFNPKIKIRMNSDYLNANYSGNYYGYAGGIRLSFNYRFGKMSFHAQKEKGIRNDDLKEGGKGQQGGGQQGGM